MAYRNGTEEGLLRVKAKAELQVALVDLYFRIKMENPRHTPPHFLRFDINAKDPVDIVRAYIRKPGGTSRLRAEAAKNRVINGVESLVLTPSSFSWLFDTEDKRAAAQRRGEVVA